MKMKVGYSTSIPIAAYGIKDNAWCEIEVEDGSDFNEAWGQLKDKVDAAVREKYPHLYENNSVTSSPEPILKTKEDQEKDFIQGVIAAIKSAQNLKSVEWHKGSVEKFGDRYPELGIAYRNQLQKFA